MAWKSGNGYILIGEDHEGGYDFNFKDVECVKDLMDMMIRQLAKSRKITLWFEGTMSKSFTAFTTKFKEWCRQQKYDLQYETKGWEADLSHDRNEALLDDLIGGQAPAMVRHLGGQLNGQQSLIEALLKQQSWSSTRPVTKERIAEVLSGAQDILEVIQRGNSATRQVVELILGDMRGHWGLREQYMEGVPGAKMHSQAYQLHKRASLRREKHLLMKMKQYGGIFLAGDGHVVTMGKSRG